jgi:hypothetical protein
MGDTVGTVCDFLQEPLCRGSTERPKLMHGAASFEVRALVGLMCSSCMQNRPTALQCIEWLKQAERTGVPQQMQRRRHCTIVASEKDEALESMLRVTGMNANRKCG